MRLSFEGEFTVGAGPDAVYELLVDPLRVGKAFPDVSDIAREGDHYTAKARVGVGHLKGTVTIRFSVASRPEERAAEVNGTMTGVQSTATFTIAFKVVGSDGGSTVRWRFEADIRGLLASLGQSLVRGAVERIVNEVIGNLRGMLGKA